MAEGKSRRVAFTFDERSLKTLEDMTEKEGHFSSMADTVRESLQISRALQSQARQGYTEVIMRNPTRVKSVLWSSHDSKRSSIRHDCGGQDESQRFARKNSTRVPSLAWVHLIHSR